MIVAHADWSIDPRGRWIAVAERDGDAWRLDAPVPVHDPTTLICRLGVRARGRPVLLGLDLPIGVPRAYAERHATESDFPAFLRALAERPVFFEVCSTIEEVCGARPFYPAQSRKGSTLPPHVAALGLLHSGQMRRVCDCKTADRPAAAALFWTLGPNQVGKAALSGWRDLVMPSILAKQPAQLWPFDGSLPDLIARGGTTIAETYPADALRQIGLRLAGSKLSQANRAALAADIRTVMGRLHALPDAALASQLTDGFGSRDNGDDAFDSLVGLLAMLNVQAGHRSAAIPNDPWITTWEGWVLGQTPC